MPARYTHDCSKCRFLGSAANYDLYVCPSIVEGRETGLARYGNEGHEYFSMTITSHVEDIKASVGGMSEDQVRIVAIFRAMPSLILNLIKSE